MASSFVRLAPGELPLPDETAPKPHVQPQPQKPKEKPAGPLSTIAFAVLLALALEATRSPDEALVSTETIGAALERAEREAAQDPKGACSLTRALASFVEGTPRAEKLHQASRRALEAALAAAPGDVVSQI